MSQKVFKVRTDPVKRNSDTRPRVEDRSLKTEPETGRPTWLRTAAFVNSQAAWR